jgi:hypothetical protein
MTETIEYLLQFLRKTGGRNFLIIGIAIIVMWLLISGFKKGLKRGERDKGSEGEDNRE